MVNYDQNADVLHSTDVKNKSVAAASISGLGSGLAQFNMFVSFVWVFCL